MSETDNNSQGEKPKTSKLAKASVFCVALAGACLLIGIATGLPFGDGALPFGEFCGNMAIWLMLAALIVGVAGAISIVCSKGRLKGIGWAAAGILLALGFFVFMVNAFKEHVFLAQRNACQNNLKTIFQVIDKYSSDHESFLPTAEKWCDLLCDIDIGPQGYPRNLSQSTLCCPRVGGGTCTYALNENLEGIRVFEVSEEVVLLFEAKPGWNQVGGPEILTTENHKGEGCNILFNDGSIRFVKTDELGQLKWKVEDSNSVK